MRAILLTPFRPKSAENDCQPGLGSPAVVVGLMVGWLAALIDGIVHLRENVVTMAKRKAKRR